MSDLEKLARQISEQMKVGLFTSPLAEFAKTIQNRQNDLLPLSFKLSEAMRQNIESIKAISLGNSIAKSILPNLSEIIKQQNQLGISSISNVITKGFASELAKNSNFFANQFKFSIPEIRIPVDTIAFQQSAGLLALQAIRHNQITRSNLSEDLITQINNIGQQAKDGKDFDEEAIDLVIQTLDRIENTLIALQNNNRPSEVKLFTIEDIRFYLNLILSLVLFIIPLIGQLNTDKKIESIETQTNQNSERLEEINDKLDKIADHFVAQEKWLCSRDTYLRQKPNFKSRAIVKVLQFETVIRDTADSLTHKWIKVKFIDTQDNEIKTGWVAKKYFKKN